MSAKFLRKEEAKAIHKKEKRHEEKKKECSPEKIKVRLIPIWLRTIIVLLSIFICLITGVVVGYSVIGDGKPQDALKKSTWTHIIDLVNKDR
ncbi:DNA-directed RNA polymerase subunit beta [Siminovitchia sp. FSL W7-1587]|uniref:DNA-directed RNA polymerase subunit beta n=1 Tax=Siminovitchia sp. FSL W7-1587 TaxID=2954699 RepID=UPI0030CCD043